MKVGNVRLEHLRGFADKGLGLGKELMGTLVGNQRLEEEGEAQQARASETLKALRKEAEAQRHEARAEAHEQRQKSAQRAKAGVGS